MNKLLLILFLSTFSYAGFYVKGVEGADSVYYSDKDIGAYNLAKELLANNPKKYLKYDKGVLVKKEQSVIDAIIKSEKDAIELAEQKRIDNLEFTVKELIEVLEIKGILGEVKKEDLAVELTAIKTAEILKEVSK